MKLEQPTLCFPVSRVLPKVMHAGRNLQPYYLYSQGWTIIKHLHISGMDQQVLGCDTSAGIFEASTAMHGKQMGLTGWLVGCEDLLARCAAAHLCISGGLESVSSLEATDSPGPQQSA